MIRKIKKLSPVPTNCPYCKEKTSPDYKEVERLGKFLTERGKVLSKARNGLCAKHQRWMAVSIKQARYLGLLPFMIRPH